MRPADRRGHRIVVVRVECRDRSHGGLLIQVLEVNEEAGNDQLLGSAADADGGCQILRAWLDRITIDDH